MLLGFLLLALRSSPAGTVDVSYADRHVEVPIRTYRLHGRTVRAAFAHLDGRIAVTASGFRCQWTFDAQDVVSAARCSAPNLRIILPKVAAPVADTDDWTRVREKILRHETGHVILRLASEVYVEEGLVGTERSEAEHRFRELRDHAKDVDTAYDACDTLVRDCDPESFAAQSLTWE